MEGSTMYHVSTYLSTNKYTNTKLKWHANHHQGQSICCFAWNQTCHLVNVDVTRISTICYCHLVTSFNSELQLMSCECVGSVIDSVLFIGCLINFFDFFLFHKKSDKIQNAQFFSLDIWLQNLPQLYSGMARFSMSMAASS